MVSGFVYPCSSLCYKDDDDDNDDNDDNDDDDDDNDNDDDDDDDDDNDDDVITCVTRIFQALLGSTSCSHSIITLKC